MKHTAVKEPTWWTRRSALERGLTILVLCMLLAVIGLAIAMRVIASLTKRCHSISLKDICLTPGCIESASQVLKYMNPDVEPCNNFYHFACGKFIDDTVISDDKVFVSTFSIISDKIHKQLRMHVAEKIERGEKKHFKLVKQLYRNCINLPAIDERGIKSVQNIIKKLGGWPVVDGDAWREEGFEWKQSVYQSRKQAISTDYFFGISIEPDLKNNSKQVLTLGQTSLGLSKEYLSKGMDNEIVKAYYNYMIDIAVHFGADKTRATEEFKQSLDFEMKLANISMPPGKLRNSSVLYNPMTIKELEGNYSRIPWKKFFNTLLSPIVEVGDDELVIVHVPSFFKEFEKLMEQTPKRVQANYVIWRAVESTISFLSEDVRNIQKHYYSVIGAQSQTELRWEECMRVTSEHLGNILGALYVRKYSNKDSRKSVIEIVTDIREEFRKILENVDWMDKKTSTNALEKLKSMDVHIAYPDELLDDRKLERFYRKLQITPGDYLQSVLNITLFYYDYTVSRFRQPHNKSEWPSHGGVAKVGASYSLPGNSFSLPAGILQGHFFSPDKPRYMNYGSIGSVIGHEITHGFNDQGRHFDKEGNLVDWWESETNEKYLSRAEKIIHQYGNYTAKEVGMKLDGIKTLEENIADNGGVKESYLAYQEWVKRNGPELKLPGLKYTPSQLFWVSTAQVWCSKYRQEALIHRITSESYSPEEFRVLGPFSNRPEFAKDFNCPSGSRMNPKDKYSVW